LGYAKRFPGSARDQDAERVAQRGGFSYNELVEYLGREPRTWKVSPQFADQAGAKEEECHVCQPFTKLVRDPERLKACSKLAAPLGDLRSSPVAYELLRSDLERQDQEVFVVLCLDFRGTLRDYAEVGRGQRHRVAVDVEDITRIVAAARDAGSDGFIVAHNHPSGIAEPSEADGALTLAIKDAAEVSLPSVHFLDHIVVGMGQYYSFVDNGWKDDGKVEKV
jgi:proteasome lid subunit RPN8/RPN11